MKLWKRMFILILLILLTVIGCKNINETPNQENLDNTSGIVEDEDHIDNPDIEETKTIDVFLSMINPDTNASELGKYMENNIQNVNYEEAEEMIKWLIIYQSEIVEDFNRKIYEPGYMVALNEDMNGILDKLKIDNISDEKIRNDYQNLIDSFLTIVRYEEHPAVETNWIELNKFSSYVSEDLGEIIGLYKKIQNYEYEREDLDILGISEDIIKTEGVLEGNSTKFVKDKANQLYNLQIYALLVGPEGSYLDIWIDRNTKAYKNIMALNEKYPDSILSKIILDINSTKIENIMDVIDIINKKQQFGLNSNKYIEDVIYNNNEEYNIIEIRIPEDKEKEDNINNIIRMDIENYLEQINIEDELTLNIFHSFEDEKYISYEGMLTYYDSQENDQKVLSFYRTLNYIEEKFVNLEGYLNTDFKTIKNDLEKISGKTIETIPSFILSHRSYGGIDLFLDGEEGMEGYIHLTEKDLVPYFIKRNK